MRRHFFVTVDAETDVIREGIRSISEVRDEVEARERVRIPIVWFVRFQRSWDEYVEQDRPEAFEGPVTEGFDGFDLVRHELVDLLERGDEVAWHYHAYNYVHRSDLSHATRIDILRTDLASCARELRHRHPAFPVETFRFGWFFVPDYSIYHELAGLGVTRDASIHPGHGGEPVAGSSTLYLPPLTATPARADGLSLFPFVDTLLLHDWNVVAHDFGWSRLEAPAAGARRREFERDLVSVAAHLKHAGGKFLTYGSAPPSMTGGRDSD
jgi:hypothetical protein